MDTTLSAKEIDQLVAWGGKFLRAASIKPDIMELLVGLGYSDSEHKHGWDLYLKMLGYRGANARMPAATVKSTNQMQALTEIDRYDEPTFRRATAALSRLHPEQYDYVFGDGLSPKSGAEAVGSVQTFLDRYVALRDGTDPQRGPQAEADQAAAATLESRNIVTPALGKHLREMIEIVKTSASPSTPASSASEESLQAAARTFAEWLRDWRTTASAGMFRRDYRIMLGISRRRVSEDAPEVAPEPAPAPPAVHA